MRKIIFVSITFLLWACSKKFDCPGFSSQNTLFLPYQNLDTLVFISQTNDTLRISISKIEKSQSYTFKCKDLYGICPCQQTANVFAHLLPQNTNFVLLQLNIFSDNDAKLYKFQIFDYQFDIDFADYEKNISFIDNAKLFDTLTINNRLYNKVFSLTNPNYSTSKVKKVYVNQQYGILKIEETNNKQWALVR